MDKIDEAAKLAAEYHKGQTYGDGSPYMAHLVRVKNIVIQMGGNEQSQIVALLHDILEDTTCSANQIEAKFGTGVVDAVISLSHGNPDEPYMDYIQRAKGNPTSKLVKIADLIDNLGNCLRAGSKFRKHAPRYAKALAFILE